MTPAPELPVPRLIVWRHGRTEWNAAGRFQGQLDPPLDGEGRRQAASTAPHVAARTWPASPVLVVSSDLTRAVQTAAPLAEVLGVPVRVDPRLREAGMGSWEGLTRTEVEERHPEQYADWLAGRPVRGRGGEDPARVAERGLAALRSLPEAPVAVVITHGGVAGRLIEALLGLGPEHRRAFGPLANCAWSELAYQEARWRLLRHNSTAPEVAVEHLARVSSATGAPEAGASPEEGAAAPVQDADALR